MANSYTAYRNNRNGGWQNTTMLHSLSIEWAGDTNQNPVVEEAQIILDK
ncbi:MAG: hypothetical protein ACLS9K_12825 [Lachnospira eligens]